MSEHPTFDSRERTQPVNKEVRRAVDIANGIMDKVPEDYPGRSDMWMMHFYASFLPDWGEPHPRLIATIEEYAEKVFQHQERAGVPDGLEVDTES